MDFLIVLALGLLPIAGNLAGSFLAEAVRVSPWLVGSALHAAAGVAIAVVSVEIMPRVLEQTSPLTIVLAFACGAAFSILLALGVEWLRSRLKAGSTGAWMAYFAVGADLFSDGLMVGGGSAVSSGLGFILGLSQVVANLPGGFATMANFRSEGVSKGKRLWISAAFVLPVLLGAGGGYLLLRGASESVKNAALAFIVGLLLLATVEDVVPQADKPGAPRWISTVSFAAGFAFFALLSSYIG